jgi:hypothetical protein
MKLQLLQGSFSPEESLRLLSQMVQLKIKYQEDKIQQDAAEEDIKWRETKIKKLQHELAELKALIQNSKNNLTLDGVISID